MLVLCVAHTEQLVHTEAGWWQAARRGDSNSCRPLYCEGTVVAELLAGRWVCVEPVLSVVLGGACKESTTNSHKARCWLIAAGEG